MKGVADGAVFALTFRDGPVCQLCGLGPDQWDPFEVDHRRPRVAAGGDQWGNLQLVHESCNKVKGTRAVSA